MRRSIYGVHPAVQLIQNAIAALAAKTGRSLEAWIALIKKDGPGGEGARKAWLKKAHKLGTNDAGWLAAAADGKGEDGDPDS